MVLDVMLPVVDGFTVLRAIRERRIGTPVLVLTARNSVADKVTGLDLGADDYLTKPFSFDELLARVRALLRRGGGREPGLRVDDLVLEPATRAVSRGGRPVPLTTREFALLELQTLVILVPVGLALAAAGGTLVARSALRPVDEMSRAARRITAEDLRERLALRGTGDELDRLAETLNGMLVRLEAAFAEMRRFTADAAHELRTPFTVLKGEIQVALRSERSTAEYRRVLASSLEEVDRLSRLADDLLLLARVSADTAARRGRVELEPLVVDVLDLATRLGHAAGVAVRLADVVPVVVTGDASSLRRALQNLVENAVKYTPVGGKVEIALTVEAQEAVLSVADTGVGIEPVETERIFEPFVRIDTARTRDTGGAGLGLALARSIVTAHGGTIGVASRPGAGSTFTIRLPRVDQYVPGRISL